MGRFAAHIMTQSNQALPPHHCIAFDCADIQHEASLFMLIGVLRQVLRASAPWRGLILTSALIDVVWTPVLKCVVCKPLRECSIIAPTAAARLGKKRPQK